MSDVLAEFYQETSEAESNEERGRYVVPVAFKLAGELSAYRAAWAKVKEYLLGKHFKSDYPEGVIGADVIVSLLDDFEKDYGIGANATQNGHPPAPPESRPLTISDDLPDLLFRKCRISQDDALMLAEEIMAMVKATTDAAEGSDSRHIEKCVRAFGMVLDCIERDPDLLKLVQAERNKDVLCRYEIDRKTLAITTAPETPTEHIARLNAEKEAAEARTKALEEQLAAAEKELRHIAIHHCGTEWPLPPKSPPLFIINRSIMGEYEDSIAKLEAERDK